MGSLRTLVVGHRVLLVGALVALALVAVAIALLLGRAPESPVDEVRPATETLRMPLTGVPVEVVPQRPALLLKVSNSPEARPQTGLEEADLVFEEVTEGGVTRFAAVFHSRLPQVAGPVRSARPVDVQLMAGFSRPGFAYSGAREEVRDLLARAPAVTLTEGAPGFFRDRGEYASHPFAPHDLFVRLPEVLDEAVDRGAGVMAGIGWAFDESAPAAEDDLAAGEQLTIPMSDAFATSWSYDQAAGLYRRAQNGVPTEVTGAGRIGAANVVVLDVRHDVGTSGYPETDVVGAGPGLVLRDGQRYPITWSKPTDTDPIILLGTDGEPFPLAPGPTWLHLPDGLPD